VSSDSAAVIATREIGGPETVAAQSVELVALTDLHGLGVTVVERPAWRVGFQGLSAGSWNFDLTVFVDSGSGRVLAAVTSGAAMWARGIGDATAYTADWGLKGLPENGAVDHSIMDALKTLGQHHPPASELILRPRIVAPVPGRVPRYGFVLHSPPTARWIHDAVFSSRSGPREFVGFTERTVADGLSFSHGGVPWEAYPGFELQPPMLGYID